MGRLKSIPLTAKQASAVERMISAGVCADPREVVKAGLAALTAQETEHTSWMRAEVLPAIEEMDSRPSCPPLDEEVFAALRTSRALGLDEE